MKTIFNILQFIDLIYEQSKGSIVPELTFTWYPLTYKPCCKMEIWQCDFDNGMLNKPGVWVGEYCDNDDLQGSLDGYLNSIKGKEVGFDFDNKKMVGIPIDIKTINLRKLLGKRYNVKKSFCYNPKTKTFNDVK